MTNLKKLSLATITAGIVGMLFFAMTRQSSVNAHSFTYGTPFTVAGLSTEDLDSLRTEIVECLSKQGYTLTNRPDWAPKHVAGAADWYQSQSGVSFVFIVTDPRSMGVYFIALTKTSDERTRSLNERAVVTDLLRPFLGLDEEMSIQKNK